jgi:hypothetical protein
VGLLLELSTKLEPQKVAACSFAYQPPASSTFSQNKSATSNQPAVLFSQNKPAPAINHQPNEQAVDGNSY